jgi:glycosyltransferase involved in cell wall biosynthesis
METLNEETGQPTVYINGRFLEQPLSGVQRYAREMVTALDRVLGADRKGYGRWCLLTTGRERERLPLDHIEVRPRPAMMTGHAWEQVTLAREARDGVLVGLGGSGAVLHSRQLVVIHDASVFRHPDFFSAGYGIWHRLIGRALARRARIATVSRFSRDELAGILKLDPAAIPVLYNGSDHMRRLTPKSDAVDRLQLHPGPYFVLLGNLTRNKNLSVAIEALMEVPNTTLVVVGGINRRVFGSAGIDASSDRLIFAGRLDDAEVAGLLEQAAGLLFPSLYEGFGIPPLEAMVLGCPVIASDIPPVKEVCGDAALYFDPNDSMALAAAMRAILSEGNAERQKRLEQGAARAASFTWEQSAKKLAALCRDELTHVRAAA